MQKAHNHAEHLATTPHSPWRLAAGLFIALLLAGCSRENQPTKPVADNDSGLTVLNEGYSMLYQDLDSLSGIDKLLLVKLERDSVNKVISAIANTAAEHVKALDRMKAASPDLQFDLDPLPEMEKRKRAAAQSDRAWGLAPVIGRTGADFERTLLLTLSGAMNQLRYLEGELAKAEVSEARREQLKRLKPDLDQRYTDIVDLLNLEYFVHFSNQLTSEQAQAQSDGKPQVQENSGEQGSGAEQSAAENKNADLGEQPTPRTTGDSSTASAGNSDSNSQQPSTTPAPSQSQPASDEDDTQYFGPRSR